MVQWLLLAARQRVQHLDGKAFARMMFAVFSATIRSHGVRPRIILHLVSNTCTRSSHGQSQPQITEADDVEENTIGTVKGSENELFIFAAQEVIATVVVSEDEQEAPSEDEEAEASVEHETKVRDTFISACFSLWRIVMILNTLSFL